MKKPPEVAAISFSSYHRDAFYDRWYGPGWNEWTEGNYLLPDQRHGDGCLRVLKESLGALPSAGLTETLLDKRDSSP